MSSPTSLISAYGALFAANPWMDVSKTSSAQGTSESNSISAKTSTLAKQDATQAFLDYQKKSPMEKIFEQILREMGLSKEDLEGMEPAKREAVMKEIAQRIEDRIKEAAKDPNREKGTFVNFLA
jgi:hypothetical protein